jgi:integrase
VQRALGHASATTTLNTYGHLSPDADDPKPSWDRSALTLLQ